jgi:hypothetical protein
MAAVLLTFTTSGDGILVSCWLLLLLLLQVVPSISNVRHTQLRPAVGVLPRYTA